ncbi:MAG: hypothetical protein KKB31_05870, partial [Nanoarchaeota archaeon]|nr:hypothetical protein [Nanoarchaeota archaeon]
MERKPEDITLIARLGFLIYGDGYTAKIVSIRPSKDQQGNGVFEFILDPSEELIKRYKIKPSNLSSFPNNPMVYITQYPYDFVIQLNPDPS